MEKVRKAIFMFSDLFGLERYNYNKLVSGDGDTLVISSLCIKGEFPHHR